jgi:hypothetical protein
MPNNIKGENLAWLTETYGSLVKAGRGSLQAAYAFGQVCDALTRIGYSRQNLADAIGKTAPTIAKYLKLFHSYSTEKALLDRAEELGHWDVGILAGTSPATPVVTLLHCLNCGKYNDVIRERKTPEEAAALLAPVRLAGV